MSDIGPEAASKSGGLNCLSRCTESHSERDAERVTRKYNLQLPVRISELEKSPGVQYVGGLNVISLKDWCKWIGDHNLFHVLVGLHHPNPQRERAILREFWRLYKLHKPCHQLWDIVDKHNVDLGRTCPMLLHGDEGRGRKRSPFLICNVHSFLGFGSLAANENRKKRPYLLQRLNYVGSTHVHRFILACLPKMVKDEVALQDILAFIAKDSIDMLCSGIQTSHGDRLHMAVLNCCGDWMFLAKAGHLTRSFANVQKRPLGPDSCPKGICHLCYAGQTGYPFEDLSDNPAWKATVHHPQNQPHSSPPVLLSIPHDPSAASGFFAFDLWHSFHLGMGKVFCATALALLSDLMSGGTVEARFSELTDVFMQWCSDTKTAPYLSQITQALCGWPDRKTFPNGMWSKGHITTAFMAFLEDWFRQNQNNWNGDVMLSMVYEATQYMNKCLQELYRSDLWLPMVVSHRVGYNGMKFLSLFQSLAAHAFHNGLALWAYMPKAHIVHHTMLDLWGATTWVINPLAYAVQLDEDYVGKKSRLARRTHPSQVILRTLQRTLMVAHSYWRETGFIKG